MFTGIVEEQGLVSVIKAMDISESGGSGFSLTISEASLVLSDASLGDSIAVNGLIDYLSQTL